uniref:Bifunctional inhibitor/plant lipid transfer protein/seed storage helical domain-containing protein n=1 Tax=Ananas comosus var. bracteatus TaxID=296719 RepID=A0A6V7QD87_ANACO|nr:unnamed protein product [Ananas comosus var. bracteatus]
MATTNTLKLTAIAALLAILASTLTTDAYFYGARDEFDGDENLSERCRREVQQCPMQPCKNFMKSMGSGGGETFGRGVLAMSATTNQMSMKEKCCRELRAVSEGCRCEAVKEMMKEMMEEEGEGGEGGGFGGGGGACRGPMEEMMRKAERLPSMCGMRPEYCRIRGEGW